MGSTAPQGRVNAAPGPAVPAEPPPPSVVEAAVAATLEADEAARQARAAMRSAQLLSATARLMEREGSQSVSMQALAEEAGVSVGLIYRYFGGKEELLFAVISDVLAAFAARVPGAIEAAGDDPFERLAAAFRSYCLVIDEHRHAAVLTYRESKTLSTEHRRQIKDLEISTSEPLRQVLREGIAAGALSRVDVELAAYNLLLIAHGWALKQWYFERTMSVDEYVTKQTALALYPLVEPRRRHRYRRLLTSSASVVAVEASVEASTETSVESPAGADAGA